MIYNRWVSWEEANLLPMIERSREPSSTNVTGVAPAWDRVVTFHGGPWDLQKFDEFLGDEWGWGWGWDIGVGAQSTLGGTTFLPEKYV